jgi:hypothetical protein
VDCVKSKEKKPPVDISISTIETCPETKVDRHKKKIMR